jgi:hypothetical protein
LDYVDEGDYVGVVEDEGEGDGGCREDIGCEVSGCGGFFDVFCYDVGDFGGEEGGLVAGADDEDGGGGGLDLGWVLRDVSWVDGLGRHIGWNDQDCLMARRIVAR